MKLSGSTKKLLIRIVLFLLYLLVGAGIFMAIESGPEKEEQHKALKFIEKVNNLTNATTRYFNSSEDVKQFLSDFKHALRNGYDIDTNKLDGPKWTYMNSFYFVGNIVTTIGTYYASTRGIFSSVYSLIHRVLLTRSWGYIIIIRNTRMYYLHGNGM